MDELDYELRDLKKYPRPETDARARFELLLGFIAADPCLIRIALRLLEDPAITFTEAAEGERISGYKFRKLRGALAESARQKGADEILEGRLKSQVTHPSRSAMMGVRLPLRLGKRKQFSTLVADVIVSTAPERTIWHRARMTAHVPNRSRPWINNELQGGTEEVGMLYGFRITPPG
jgi:hypothetical protein